MYTPGKPDQQGTDLPQYGMPPPPMGQQQYMPPPPMGPQQTGVVGQDVEAQQQSQQLPPRPQQAKLAVTKMFSKFRK